MHAGIIPLKISPCNEAIVRIIRGKRFQLPAKHAKHTKARKKISRIVGGEMPANHDCVAQDYEIKNLICDFCDYIYFKVLGTSQKCRKGGWVCAFRKARMLIRPQIITLVH
jgi:hypothetical protein